MKRPMILAVAMLVAPGAFAATGTWTGKISDSMCEASHAKMASRTLRQPACGAAGGAGPRARPPAEL